MVIVSKKKKKVFVAMSGGVDSSVAAALLKERGFDVAGVFMKFWTAPIAAGLPAGQAGENKCCSIEAYHDALAVADKLGIKLYTFNFEKEFKKKVVDYFTASLKHGETPNPCVVCNREIKFGLLLEKILKLGGNLVATGHYVKNQKSKIKNPARQRSEPQAMAGGQNDKSKFKITYKLFKARDRNKDQSYFLWAIRQEQLAKFLFPVGNYTKPEVRQIAKDFGLPIFQKRDSEDLCFVGDHLGGFIKEYVKPREGDIVDMNGKKIGAHNGIAFYTIGQRKGLNISNGPWYVYKKDAAKNQLIVVNPVRSSHGVLNSAFINLCGKTVGHSASNGVNEKNKNLLFSSRVSVENINWIAGVSPKFPLKVMAKIRYQHKPENALLTKNNNKYIIKFQEPQLAITPGQSAVFYKGDELLGGGVISK